MTSEVPKFAICIVTWRSRELLRRCLHSIVGQPEVSEIVVVDNDSRDGTRGMLRNDFPGVKLLANGANVGFAAGNNQAIRETRAPFLLLLNPDTEVQPGALGAMLDVFAEDARAGAVAAQLVLPDGSVQLSCRSFPDPAGLAGELLVLARVLSPRDRRATYRMRGWAHDTRREVDQPMASALALRREALEEVGLFDEDFPLFFNDVDLCYRLREAEWRIIFEPKAKVLHVGGGSTWQVRPAALLASHKGLIRFYRKHYRGKLAWRSYWSVIISAWLTMGPRAGLVGLGRLIRKQD